MRKKPLFMILAGAVIALAIIAVWNRPARKVEPATQSASVTAPPVAPTPPADPGPSEAPVIEEPSTQQGADTSAAVLEQPAAAEASAQAAGPMPEPSERFKILIAELRPKVDAALRASDFQAADRHVDEVLATEKLEPLEKQRLMVVKMGTRGMRGDHAAMLALMDEIIAVDPSSPLSAQMRAERPQLEKIHRLGPNHPELCETCGQIHAPGQHSPPNIPQPPQK